MRKEKFVKKTFENQSEDPNRREEQLKMWKDKVRK